MHFEVLGFSETDIKKHKNENNILNVMGLRQIIKWKDWQTVIAQKRNKDNYLQHKSYTF